MSALAISVEAAEPLAAPLVLIVDDNADDRERYIRALNKVTEVDYHHIECAGGASMMEGLDREAPDCILLDYSLPGRNGLELLEALSARGVKIPVVMMTGQGNESIAVQALKAGAQNYLIKSDVTPDLLHHAIQSAIRQSGMERERAELIERLIASNTELERFAYVASHDLQEPIRMIMNFSKILEDDYQALLDETGRDYLNLIHQASTRMRDMVRDLLAYSRLESAGEHVALSCDSAVTAAQENLSELIRETDTEITAASLPQVYGNPVQITRLFQNLFTNAIRYQRKGNRPRIQVDYEQNGSRVYIYVRDNGLGVDPQFCVDIFKPFRRLHVWDEVPGTGLGLAICKRIVESHGGKIMATSTPGEGSVFTFSLPVADKADMT